MTAEPKSKCTDIEWLGRADCKNCGIKQKVLFSPIPSEAFDNMLAPIDHYVYQKKVPLYEAGQEGDFLYTVRRGLIKLYQYLPNGDLRVVRLLKPGDIAGLELLVNHKYHHSAMTTHESDLCRIPVSIVHQLERQYPDLFQKLISMWQESLDAADLFITKFSTGTSQVRMARLLFEMTKEENSAWGPNLSREDMGDILGMSTETASRIIADFKRRGLISEKNNELFFDDVAGLEAVTFEK